MIGNVPTFNPNAGGAPQGPAQPVNQQFEQQDQQQPQPTMQLKFSGEQGERQLSEIDLMNDMRKAGSNPVGISPDGKFVEVQDSEGTHQIPMETVAQKFGFQFQGWEPLNANYDNLSHGARLAVGNLPDDNLRKQYLEQFAAQQGMEGNIVGSGRDWYLQNPDGSHTALTNNPGWDLTDATEFANEAFRGVGGLMGMVGGTMVAPGAGSIAGGVGGELAANAAVKGGLAAFDPAFRDVASNNMGAMGKDVAMDTGINAAFGGLGAMLPGFAKRGVASSATEVAGNVMNKTGRAVDLAGKGMQNQMGADIATAFTPAGPASMAGYAAQAPDFLANIVAKGVDKVNPRLGAQLTMPRTINRSGIDNVNANIANGAGASNQVFDTQALGRNVGELVGHKIDNFNYARHLRNPRPDADTTFQYGAAANRGQQIGQKTGKFVEDLADAGQVLETAARIPVQALGTGARGVGTGLEKTGSAMQQLGKYGRHFENPYIAARSANYGFDRLTDDTDFYSTMPKAVTEEQWANRQ